MFGPRSKLGTYGAVLKACCKKLAGKPFTLVQMVNKKGAYVDDVVDSLILPLIITLKMKC